MMPKIINGLEIIGALLMVAAFTLWSGEWWRIANYLWWSAIIILTPVIVWKNWEKDTVNKIIIWGAFCLLLIIGRWWFGKRDIKVNIPYLPEVTIHR